MLFTTSELKAIRGALFIRTQSLPEGNELIEPSKSALRTVDAMLAGDVVASPWWIDDVKSLTEDYEGNDTTKVTDAEARAVLAAAVENHDASIGINWDVLQCLLDDTLSERGEDPNGGDGQDD